MDSAASKFYGYKEQPEFEVVNHDKETGDVTLGFKRWLTDEEIKELQEAKMKEQMKKKPQPKSIPKT